MVTGILIITWNSAEVIGSCLSACERIPGARIVVVDNASSDDTVTEVRKHASVELYASDVNLGFAGGVNAGMKVLYGCDAVLLLNPDAVLLQGMELLADAALRPGSGAAAGKLIDPDGAAQEGFNVRRFPGPWTLAFEALGLNRLWPSNPVNRRYRMIPAPRQTQDVEQPAAAFLMVNRRAWERVGGFDDGFYPVWFEDVDFCWRLRDAGYRILWVPDAVARHIGGHSAARLRWDSRQLFWYGSLLRYAYLRFSPFASAGVASAVMACSLFRAVAGSKAHGVRAATDVYSKVFGMAWTCWRNSIRSGTTRNHRHERKGQTARFRSE